MTTEERYLNCFLAWRRAQNPSFKKIWFNKMQYFERKLKDDVARDFRKAHSQATN